MDDLERKLKAYYEGNPDYVPSAGFADRLTALESGPAAVPKRRRRRLLPAAAAIAAVLGVGWLWLQAAVPEKAQEPVQAPTSLETQSAQNVPPGEKTPPEPKPTEEQLAGRPASPAKPEQNAAQPPAPTASAPEKQERVPAERVPEAKPTESAEPPEPIEEAPVIPPADDPPVIQPPADDPPMDDPPVVQPPADDPPVVQPPADDPPADDPPADDPPADDPPADDPQVDDPPAVTPPEDDPPVIRLEEHDIDASYLMEDGRETLALRCLSTGASVELDVTGWQEELTETSAPPPGELPLEDPPEAATAASAYAGRSSVIDIIFDKNIVFYLILEDDGTVRVKLDVTES